MDCRPPGSSVHGISQARLLEWVAISFSRESSQAKDQTHSPALAGRFFTTEPPRDPAQDPARGNLILTQMLRSIGLAKKLIWVFRKMVWKNLNELFGQPNIMYMEFC